MTHFSRQLSGLRRATVTDVLSNRTSTVFVRPRVTSTFGASGIIQLFSLVSLVFLPACGTTGMKHLSAGRSCESAQFSAKSPCELESGKRHIGNMVEAVYPEQTSASGTSRPATNHKFSQSPPIGSHPEIAHRSEPVPHSEGSVSHQNTDGVARLSRSSQNALHAAPAVTSATNPIRDRSFLLTSHQQEQPAEQMINDGFIPAEPRVDCPPGTLPGNAMETIGAGPNPDLHADEYVMDGGDRSSPVQTATGNRYGLDSEDTVAQFADHTGAQRIRPSNRVAVYSPRFGSVRTVSGLETGIKIDSAVGAGDYRGTDSLITGSRPEANVLGSGVAGLESRKRPDGAETSLPASVSVEAHPAAQARKVDQGVEGKRALGPVQFATFDHAIVSQQARNAVVWTRNQFPQISASTTSAGELRASFKVQQTIGVEDERKTKGDVRILKLADRETARPGDTIRFTIQYENTGDFDVYDVKIVDNLTPRLQYIADSASLDDKNPGKVSVSPNGEGSSVLTFTLNGPLKGHASGVITFEARVR
ncbi:MAG: hypothetical protein ACK526_07300 [Planctomyces sp.]|jgi:uncharacterized repeat protein (TIGR01451 family)